MPWAEQPQLLVAVVQQQLQFSAMWQSCSPSSGSSSTNSSSNSSRMNHSGSSNSSSSSMAGECVCREGVPRHRVLYA
jgi:hypothetical protein